jgi:hypothetical protein
VAEVRLDEGKTATSAALSQESGSSERDGQVTVNSDREPTPLNPDDAAGILRGLRAGGKRIRTAGPTATEMLIELARGISNATRMLAVGDIGPVPRLC